MVAIWRTKEIFRFNLYQSTISVKLTESLGSCVIATRVAHAATPGNANGAIAIATTSEEMQSSWEEDKLDL